MQTVKTIIIGLLICWGCSHVRAQVTVGSVTVGSMEEPVKGALLDLKSHVPDGSNATSEKGGLLLPRVALQDTTTLQPFIDPSSSEWQAGNIAKTKSDHTGLLVYNVSSTSPFHPGIYVWNGSSWGPVTGSYIQLPAFNLPWITTSPDSTFNLFDSVYTKNFAPVSQNNYVSSSGGTVDFPPYDGNSANFYYVVTDYDPTVYGITGITSDGVMTYTCKGGSSRPAAKGNNLRINAIMIKK